MSAIFIFYFIILFLKFYIGDTLFGNILSALCTMLPISLFIYFSFTYYSRFKTIISIIVFIILFGYISSIFSQNYRANDYLLCIQYFGMAFVPLLGKINYKISKFFLIAIIVFFISYILREFDPNQVFANVSRNSISVFLLIFFGIYCIACVQNDKKVNILYAFLCFLISIWAVGRGGIIAFGVILCFLSYCNSGKLSLKVVMIFSVILLLSIYVVVLLSDTLFLSTISRISVVGLEDVRSTVNQDYFNVAIQDFQNALMGAPLSSVDAIKMLDGNPHNSFIRLHAYYGLFVFIGVIFLIIISCYRYFKIKQYVYILLLVVLLFRSSVDSAAFHGPFDPLIFFLIFNSFYLKKTINNVEYV